MWKSKNRVIALLSAFLILMAGSGIGSAAEIIVHNGESLQMAVDNATEGDTIIIEPGTYNQNVTIEKPDITIMSKSGNPDDTIIQGIGMYDGNFYLSNGASGTTFKGITLKGTNDSGGVVCDIYTGGTIENCKIINQAMGISTHMYSEFHVVNNKFIDCNVGVACGEMAIIYVSDNTFIDCGKMVNTDGDPGPLKVELKNNTEISTNESNTTPVTSDPVGSVEPIPTPIVPAEPTPITNETISESDSDSSSGSSHHSSSSGGGGAGGSPEPAKNIQVKEISQNFISNGKDVTFNFTKNATCVESITFRSTTTAGKTTTIVEELKNKSSLVSKLPEGIVYKSFNVWVGNGGYGTSKSIENASVNFKVNTSWVNENNINKSSILLNRYDDKKKEWVELPVNLTNEDDRFLHFTANVPGYSSFAITGTKGERNAIAAKPAQIATSSTVASNTTTIANKIAGENKKTPGFGIISGIVCLFCIFLYRIKRR
ncbi:PGF-pre-PGF domain-containing protein [Methanosarcina sp. Z-7115]|uniref:PGF-pre-PGF domain-containing protein n=1 Tax=Methanosarcina baikalica TaxID=3073890 RepID=A0ABU2D4Q7_9EURY|nr:PGF-pre-PGF domain-containing protein [Methanosarcina sp. Z-7115]MDR7666941.1 PGF-pre-PGF domain-containing protein [Methanosarcina sp. Z-7115]